MEHIMEVIHYGELIFVTFAIFLCDFIGVGILLITVVKSAVKYFRNDKKTKLALGNGIALALEFKLAGEVLRTVTMRTWNELAVLGTIILLRAAIALLIHWEIAIEMKMEQRAAKTKESGEVENGKQH